MVSRVQLDGTDAGWRWRVRALPVAARLFGPVAVAVAAAYVLGASSEPESAFADKRLAAVLAAIAGLGLTWLVLDRATLAMRRQVRANRRLLRRLVDTQETERRALARELHDGPTQALVASLQQLDGPAAAVSPEARGRLRDRLRATVDDLRRIIRGIRPVTLDALGVERALARHVEELSRASGLTIAYEFASARSRLPEPVELALFRAAQEALSNVVRHAGATRASVVLVRTDGAVTLVVEDDGCGFSPSAPGAESVGLRHMHERALLVGGRCEVLSEPGRGTTVRLHVPVADSSSGGAA